ncbi:LPXTG cell wall anchor domain-containing protein [Streptomyces atriruber]|uniref:LPXTG cell wall anchor domain-containing protein n=1 Tax=Streptomyces atriruber TaxID=545121 RepID=UPI0006E1CC78|nr:LPXTG cell wall anchor domain-containing protein [Streptomyces atriruber]
MDDGTACVRVVGDGATLTDDLSGVLDDADWNDDATASKGSADFDRPELTWTGDAAAGEKVTPPPVLPETGTDRFWAFGAIAALLLGGGGLVLAARRRR